MDNEKEVGKVEKEEEGEAEEKEEGKIKSSRCQAQSAAARQLSSSTPASVYKQSHSCWH